MGLVAVDDDETGTPMRRTADSAHPRTFCSFARDALNEVLYADEWFCRR